MKMNEDKALYSISVIADLIGEHPETLRVWERNGLISPDRSGYQRRYTGNDLRRLNFIKFLIDEKGFNVASIKHLIGLYPCWYGIDCAGGGKCSDRVNQARPCWKEKDTYCFTVKDKCDMCISCRYNNN